MKTKCNVRNAEPGFSLIELMIVIAILMIVTGGIFSQINTAQQRMHTEQSRVDNFDEARDFVDQFFRDINQIGYPNGRIVSFNPVNRREVAVGLVQIDGNSIWFEGDVSGTGVVQVVRYMINGSGNCALCLQRSQVDKINGASFPAGSQSAPAWGTEVNDVVTNPIFTYFDTTGAQIVALPADIVANPTVLASVKTIHIALTIQNNAIVDLATRQPIQSNFEGEVSLNNCSLAINGWPMSCR